MSQATVSFPNNPYVGPRPFRGSEKQLFFGRDREIRELADLLIAERVVLLHAPSGAGKTSLLRAGLLPQLDSDFDILPLARVGQRIGPESTELGHANRYVLSTLLSWESNANTSAQTATGLASLSLEKYLASRPSTGKPQLLVFDQFEELLTANAYDQSSKAEFFRQVAELLRRHRSAQAQEIRWALFAFREEFLAALQPYFHKLSGITPETYRLDLLGVEAAVAAVQRPADEAGVTFLDGAARHLVNNLRRVQSEQGDPSLSASHALGAYVEPVQLQVVCFRFWQRLATLNKYQVASDDVDQLADVDNALGGYYADKIREISQARNMAESTLRTWIADHLITLEGYRAIVQVDAGHAEGLDADTILALQDTFLIRKEERRGLSWLELAHDRLIDPIQKDNEKWFAKELQPFQLQATRWKKQQKPQDLLVRDLELFQAEQWTAKHPGQLRGVDKEFLATSRAQVSTLDAIKLRYYRWWLYLSMLAVVGTTVYALVQLRQAKLARTKADEAKSYLASARAELAQNKVELAQLEALNTSVQDDFNRLKILKGQIERESVDRLSAVLRLPMQSAAALATAKTKEAAHRALENWKQLFEIIGPLDNVQTSTDSPYLQEIERIINDSPSSELTPRTRERLASATLTLSRKYGPSFLKHLSAGDRGLAEGLRKPLFDEAQKVTEALAKTTNDPSNSEAKEKLTDRFWQLYYGELPVVEGTDVSDAMVQFGKALKSGQSDQLVPRANALKNACKFELGKPANPP